MQLSPNFKLEEFLATSRKIDNTPPPEDYNAVVANLTKLATTLLQPIRDKFGVVFISSGYRSPALNKLVGGAALSDHQTGSAADFKVFGTPLEKVWEWIRDSDLKLYQVILENGGHPVPRWIHIALPRRNDNRRMCFKLP